MISVANIVEIPIQRLNVPSTPDVSMSTVIDGLSTNSMLHLSSKRTPTRTKLLGIGFASSKRRNDLRVADVADVLVDLGVDVELVAVDF